MPGTTLQRRVRITNPRGLHLRPVQEFVKTALQFQSDVALTKGDRRVNGRSPLELLTLGADEGTELLLEVSGSDAHAAIEPLAEILATVYTDEEPDPPAPAQG